jgi:ribulose-phosphate 3-epimerase
MGNEGKNREETRMTIIAPSILSANFSKLGEEVQAVEKAGADWIHVDVIGPLVVNAVHEETLLPLDVHLMIENPERYVDDFARAGASLISVHAETCVHLNRTIAQIRETGAQAGVVLNPSTPLSAVDWVLENVDLVLIMSVNPGFGGQQFIPNSLSKIRALRRIIDDRGLTILIEVDGGVNTKTIADVARAGADVFVAGSAIFNSEDYSRPIRDFREKIKGTE